MRLGAANRRIAFLGVVFALLLGVALVRAFWIQVVDGSAYAAMAVRQHRETVVVAAGRGTIFDRNGEPLAIGEQMTTVYANPRQITNPNQVTLDASRILGVDPEKTYQLLTDKSLGFVYVDRKGNPEKAAKLEKLDLPGLGFYPEELRTYPQDRIASQVLGFAGTDNHGLEGLEKSLDPVLAGHPGSETIVKDPLGRALDVVSTKPATPGKSVRLTIDDQVQANAQQVIESTVQRFGAKSATAIVMDPYSGDILAMAVAPGFNANRFATTRPDRLRNRAVTDMYEPGSTFKLVTISAALEDGVVTPRSSFVLPPELHVADRVIHDAEARGTERMSVRQIIERSSNIGTVTIAEKLGPQPPRRLGEPLWLRQADRNRLPGRVGRVRASARPVVRVDDRNRSHRARHRGHAAADGEGVLRDRERRDARAAASDREDRRAHGPPPTGASRRVARRLRADDVDAAKRRPRRHRHRGGPPRLHRGREDGNCCEDRPGRALLHLAVRRVLRGNGSRDEAAARDHGHGR